MFIEKPQILITLEKDISGVVKKLVEDYRDDYKLDYDAASTLFPFWENYPPDERGRDPIGDQYPWIEVGEHAIGTKIARSISEHYQVSDIGFPTGADQRFVLTSPEFLEVTEGLTDTVWLFLDIKSVGPRDDQDHTVMSHNQISGSGDWTIESQGVANSIMVAQGKNAKHDFYPALPPLVVLPNGKVAPVLTMAVKPVYSMVPTLQDASHKWLGQPLSRIDSITIPNGLLLTQNPNYLKTYPGLLFPGKDDKSKDPRKLRARVSFTILRQIATWRHETIASWL
jgi:hypothetical protein